MTSFATQTSIQMSAPGLPGRAASGAGFSKLLTASELRGLLGTGSAGLGAKYLADNSTWKSIDLSGYVPYTGATGAVNLGSYGLTVGAITASGSTTLFNSLFLPTTNSMYYQTGGSGTKQIEVNSGIGTVLRWSTTELTLASAGIIATAPVGIGGTPYASSSLHIQSSFARAILLNNSTIGTGVTDGAYFGCSTTGQFTIYNQESASPAYTYIGQAGALPIYFATNDITRLTIGGEVPSQRVVLPLSQFQLQLLRDWS